ncbi:MAG: PAS domain S-box protein [Deltaproteobacteria bacterium]|nr:MAG: PAS domain S-box protein [Deltaproteobacteria bacterium]
MPQFFAPNVRYEKGKDLISGEAALKITSDKGGTTAMVTIIDGDTLRSVIDNLPVFVYRGFPDWSISVAGRAVRDLTGYAPAEFTSGKLTWREIVHPDDLAWLRERFRDAVKIQTPSLTTRYRIVRKDGEARWVEDRRLFSYAPDGRLLFVDGVLFDVTDLVEKEEALRVSEERFRKVAESAHDAIITVDPEGKVYFWNFGAEKIFGYPREEILGKDFTLLVPEGARDFHKKIITQLQEGGDSPVVGKVVDVEGLRKSGERFPIEISIAPWGEKGKTYLTAIIRDVSERKRLENALREERDALKKAKEELQEKHAQLQRLFSLVEKAKKEWERTMDCVEDLIFLLDQDGRIVRCNRAALSYLGRDYREILGKNLDALLKTHIPQTGTTYGDGKELFHEETGKWFVLRVYAYRDEKDDTVTGKVVTLHDTTDLKKAHQELEKAYEDLKRTQAQILQQDKMASIGQLAAGVAHEINNPMGFISSNLGTMKKYAEKVATFLEELTSLVEEKGNDELKGEVKSLARKMKVDLILEDLTDLVDESLEGAARVRKIVQDLKSFSRVDEAEQKHADINECLESTINIVWNEIKYKAKLIRDFGDLPQTKCYPQQLNQVFMNLLVNAAQAIEKEGEIRVKTWHEDGNIFVRISDTGCGIPPENLNRIFEPFFTTKEVGKGTGLGLSISYDIVKKHGGDIQVESQVGEGTTFTIRIPVVEGR